MKHGKRANRTLLGLVLSCLCVVAEAARAEPFRFAVDDSVVVLGNTFAERMQVFGYFETFLHCRFPRHRLRIRGMAWPADEVGIMERPLGFPNLFEELRGHRTDVLLLCFGMNESFRGSRGMDAFRDTLNEFVVRLRSERFNGDSPPRIVIISPIAHEERNDRFRDVAGRNRQLRRYANAMGAVARANNCRFVDIFTPTLERTTAARDRDLTFNGIHLTEYGDWAVSQMLARKLELVTEISRPARTGGAAAERLRRLVHEKNYHFQAWWRAPNASYIHGRRKDKPGARHLERERKLQLSLVDQLDRQIWSRAKPDPAAAWQALPREGRPVWHPTPGDRSIDGVDAEPTVSVPSDGDQEDSNSFHRAASEQLALFHPADDYEVGLFASEQRFPIANPMAIQFDSKGRLWVANTPTWPHPLPGKQPRDSIVILSDDDGDGSADSHHVFVDRLNLLHGFALGPDGVYIAQTPNLVLARDTDGDDKADWFRVVLQGFGAEDAEHSINNFRWSPGGWLFFGQGIFFHTQVETPDGPARVRDAAVFRYHPASQRFDIYLSHEFSNPYGIAFDRWGRGILLDASGGDYYPMDVFSANFAFPKKKERTRHLSFGPGGSIAAGCDFLHGPLFPEEVQGRFLVNHCEGEVGTHWYTLKSRGTSYQAQRHEPPLLTCDDRAFRPVAMAVGPDGALYVADFYSHIFENVNFSKRHPGRDHARGRIWRISHKGRRGRAVPDIRHLPSAGVLAMLKGPLADRDLARRELRRRDRAEVLPALERWVAGLDDGDPLHEAQLCEAMWVYESLGEIRPTLIRRLLNAAEVGPRIAALRTLRAWQREIDGAIELIAERIHDADPRVRLQALLACGFNDSPSALETALGVADHEMDAGLEHALDQTLDFLEQRK